MENIFWKGYSKKERHSTINTIKDTVMKYGDIVDFKQFSDLTLTMIIEIEEFKIDLLYIELDRKIGLDNFELLNSNSPKERTVFFNITFTSGTGNLINEIPSVPG